MTLHAETTKNRNGMLSLGILLVSTPVCVCLCARNVVMQNRTGMASSGHC